MMGYNVRTMATTRKYDLEIHFLALELSPALKLSAHSVHELGIDLVCPRPTVARKSSQRAVALERGVFAPASPAWSETAVFKETINGRFGLEVAVSEAVPYTQADYFARTGASALAKLLAGALDSVVGGPLGDVAEIPLSTLSKAIAKDKTPVTLLRGFADFPADASFASRTVVEIALKAERDIFQSVRHTTKSGTSTTRRKLLARGGTAGVCRLALEAM